MSDTNHDKQIEVKVSKPFYKNWLVWVVMVIGISPIAFFAIFLGYRYGVQLPKAKQALPQLEIEFKAIAPLPNANIVRYDSSYRETWASVDASYSTEASSTDIFNYYDAQLRQHGWQFKSTRGLTDWGQDLGGKTVEYCKGDYSAELDYAGQKANYGWTYAFRVGWEVVDCK